jgi:hypothetical protein
LFDQQDGKTALLEAEDQLLDFVAAETSSAPRVTFPDCPGIAVLNLAALPVMLAFIAAVIGFRD